MYEEQREEQRKQLRDYLSVHEGLTLAGLKVVKQGGKGSSRYRGNYSLKNWKWVEVKSKDGFNCVISLNMLDRDPKSNNIHSLYDRIGLVLTLEKWLCTDIDLPLAEEENDNKDDCGKLEQIAKLVLEQYEAYKKSKGAHEI